MQGDTPTALAGAKVIDAPAVAQLKQGGALLLDVAEAPKKPGNGRRTRCGGQSTLHSGRGLAGGRRSGNSGAAFQSRFDEKITRLTGGGKEKPIMVFCHPKCWGSWNAAQSW